MFAAHALQISQSQAGTASRDRSGGSAGDPIQYLGFSLLDAGRLYTRHFQERSRELTLDLTQCRALLMLAENEGVTQQRLAELASIDPAALGRVLDRLEGRGCVARRPRPGDRRARSLGITREGRDLVPIIREIANESQLAALRSLSSNEAQILAKALDRVLMNLKAHRSGAALSESAVEGVAT